MKKFNFIKPIHTKHMKYTLVRFILKHRLFPWIIILIIVYGFTEYFFTFIPFIPLAVGGILTGGILSDWKTLKTFYE